jgi:hypothetical protein
MSFENIPSLQLWFPTTNNSFMTAMQTYELGAIPLNIGSLNHCGITALGEMLFWRCDYLLLNA